MKVPIRVYNRFLDLEGEIDTYQSLQFGRSYHGVADFELHVNRYMHEAQKLNKGDIIALGKQSNKAAIILTKETALDQNGKETENFKLTGSTLDGLMSWRVVVPPKNESHDKAKGNAETVMKHFVKKHFVNPDDPKRVLPHLEIAPNRNRGNYIEYESRWKSDISEVLESISIKTGLGWGIFTNFKTKKLIFDVFEANDLTQGNPYGNNPVFFSPEFETIKSQSYVDSDKDLKTVGYVGGQGEGTERKIVTVGHNTGWDRIETFIDARDVGESDDEELTPGEIEKLLKERGKEKMSEMITLRSLEAEILTPVKNISPFQYEKDFDLGDKVQVVNKSWGLTMTAPITEFKEIHEPSGFSLEATFGRSRPTIVTKIEDKFNEIDGIEKQELPAQIAVDTKKYTDHKVLEEEQKRMEQAQENLDTSKSYTEEYAEKQIPSQPTPPFDPKQGDKWVDTSVIPNQMKLYDGENWNAVKGEKGDRGPQGPNIVDTNTSFGVNWLVAEYIKSLNGLNVNNQFVVDNAGNVSLGNDRVMINAGGSNPGVHVKNGAFTLEDDVSDMKYNATPKRNIVKDHSFELVKADVDSLNGDSVKYNWLEMKGSNIPSENKWKKSGNPKVAIVFGPDDRSALPIFGEQAIVVRNANYVRQYIYDGVAAGMVFTATGFFKRQHNVVAGGKPRFEIDHLDAAGNFKTRLTNTIFPAVPDDYTFVRHSLVFQVPDDFAAGDSLDFKISGGNNEWVQCDGIQIVEGNMPSVYLPEDSMWEITKGNYPVINNQPSLWVGAIYLLDSHIIYPNKPLDRCQNGWVLVWSYYDIGVGPVNSDWQFTYVPKKSVSRTGGHRTAFRAGSDNLDIFKYYFVFNNRIKGHNVNGGVNRNLCLREILEF